MMHPKRLNPAVCLLILSLVLAACEPLTTLPQQPTPTGLSAIQPTGPLPTQPAAVTATLVLPIAQPTQPPAPSNTPAPSPTPQPEGIRFAVIGDYGEDSQGELDVSNLIKSWSPDFIITVGDNNYPIGSAETIDDRIGKYYHEFIYPYHGSFGQGAQQNRFFPTLGNHDWDSFGAQPYLEYFELPGNERYYDFSWGPVYFLAIDSDSREPDGVSSNSVQAQWAEMRLKESISPWKVVFFHHAPYSSGTHGPVDWMRWPFAEWGASVVLSGHDHVYERLAIDEIPYFINGLGGGPIYAFHGLSEGSQLRYNNDYGAMLVAADAGQMTFQFFNRGGQQIDSYQLTR